MSSLTQVLLDPAKRPVVVQSLASVVDQEVAGKGGLGGAALKTTFAAAKKAKEGFLPKAIDRMLPDFATKLQPYWDAKGDQPFGAYLAAHGDEVADQLLAVVDEKVGDPSRAAYAKPYNAMRPKAKQNVVDALPKVGAAIEAQMA